MDKNTKNIGKGTQIIGPVLDIRFEEGHLPELNNAVTIDDRSQAYRALRSRSTSATAL